MEGMGVLLDEDWESMSRAFALEEEGLLNNWRFETPSILNNNWSFETPSIYSPIDEQHTNMHYSDALVSNFQYFCQETSNTSSSNNVFSATSTLAGNAGFLGPMEGSVGESKNYATTLADTHCSDDFSREIFRMEEGMCQSKLENEPGQLKRKLDIPECVDCAQQKYDADQKFKNPQKKARVSNNGRCKKNQKCITNFRNDDQSVEEKKGSSRICYSSEDDCNAYQDFNKGSIMVSKKSTELSANGKTRGSRVGATDPQSVYARRRREKINERLRILQNLIPNGTKVDISTMLEEAVHYVKFLQQQIKLLSSDELWMYAPIAYNGMDSGLHHRISSTP